MTTLSRYEAPLLDPTCPAQESWEGWLTLDNLEAVATRMRSTLDGQRYTFVAVNGLFGDRPEVRTGNRLSDRGITASISARMGHITWSDNRFVTGLHTTLQTQDDAREQASKENGERRLTRVTFEPCFRDPGTMLFELWTGAGHRLYWCISVEHPERDR